MGGIKFRNEDGSLNDKETIQIKEGTQASGGGGAIIEENTESERQTFEDPAVLYREERRTDAYSEHYVNNDGTAKTVISANPVNYFDEETKTWEKIDLTVKEKDGYYESRAGSVAAKFSKIDSGDNPQKVEMCNGEHQITWEYVGKTLEERLEKTSRGASLRIDNSLDKKGVAVYENTETDTDIEYKFDGKNLKENIIVKEKSSKYKYNFIMDTHGLNIKLSDNNDSIEVYSAGNTESGVDEKIAFYIPSPVMWDAEGNSCNEVYYEVGKLNEDKYDFSVVASEDWINAEERVFPVTIDPQIVTDFGSLFTCQVQRAVWSVGSGAPSSWADVNGISNVKVLKSNSWVYRTCLTINRSSFIIPNNRIVSVKLILTPSSVFEGQIGINNRYQNYNSANGRFEVYVTEFFTSCSNGNFNIYIHPYYADNKNIDGTFYKTVYGPIIEVEYLTNETTQTTKKTYSLAGVANGKINIATGDTVIDFCDIQGKNSVFGLDVRHVYKKNLQNYYTGENFRLNLNETFIKNNDSALDAGYIYTDENGDKHGFKDYYYFFNENGNKEYVTVPKSNIEVEADGTLKYNGRIIYSEYKSAIGLQAITQLEDFKYVSFFEQRSDEIKHIEEKIANYGNTLKEFVLLYRDSGQIYKRFEDYLGYPFGIEWLINKAGDYEFLLLTESEALAYGSLLLQHNGLTQQLISNSYQQTGLNLSKVSMQKQIATMDNTKVLDPPYKNIPSQESINIDIKQNLSDQISLATNQYENIADIKRNVVSQINNTLETIYAYRNKKNRNIEQVKAYYKIYYAALDEQNKKYRQTPVNFLTDGKIIKGYNKFGEFVFIQDGYGNYSIIEYERVNVYSSNYRISRIYDNSNKVIDFDYSADNKLSCVTDVFGKRTKFEYVGSKLNRVKYDTGEDIELEYLNNNIVSVKENKNQLKTNITYSGNKPTNIVNESLVRNISDGDYVADGWQINSTTFSYVQTAHMSIQNVLIVQDNVREEYSLNPDTDSLISYVKEVDNLVVDAERYEYKPYFIGDIQQQNPRRVVIKVDKSCLHIAPLNTFSFVDGTTEYSVLNQFNKPITTTISGIKLNADGTNTLTAVTTYTYDDNQRVIEEHTAEEYTNPQKVVDSYVRYNYNSSGDVIRKESFVAGEEYTNGKTVEETVYDDKGNVIKTFTYNTLDASSKYYTEKMFDENGKVISEANDSGEHITEYEYADNTGELNTVKYSNGSKFSYGRDFNGTVISITQSDESGEGNSTELSYTCGELTKATSGNNTVKYTYDGKRRVKQVDFNGTEEYLKIIYADNIPYSNLTLNVIDTTNKKGENFTRWYYRSGEIMRLNYNNNTVLLYDYNDKMQVTSITDETASVTHTYQYDGLDRQIAHGFGINSVETEYDDFGAVSNTIYKFNTAGTDKVEYAFIYSEDSKRMLKRLAVGAFTEDYETDALGRTKTVEKTFGNKTYGTDYGYYKAGDRATNLINTVYRFKDGITEDKITYTYDGACNIVSVNENGRQKYKYIYDSLGRLLSEKDLWNNKETVYTYDNKGNILTKTVNGVVTRYRYAKGTDKLVSFGDESFVYDVIGNPTTFRNMTATWTKGRQLASLSDGTNTVTYNYDGFGIRKSKSVGGITTEYIYADGKLLRQMGSNTIDFIYGADGITGIKVNEDNYLFIKNIQGDVEKIINSNGEIVGEYTYTAYGECTIITNTGNIAEINPIRYRGYYYDEETNLYYLKSRYYDPELGRFITIDDISYIDSETINGLNLYAYCGNNPVMRVDENGTAWWHWLIGVVIIVAAVALSVVTAGIAAPISAALGGGMLGVVVGGAVAGAIGGAIVSFGISVAIQGISKGFENIDWMRVGIQTAIGAVTGAVLGGIGGGIKYARAASYLKANGITDVKAYLNNFKGIPSLKTSNGVHAYRYYDGINAAQKGRWLTNSLTDNPIKDLVLYNNKATMVSEYIINEGVKYLVGRIAKSSAGALQYVVANINWLTLLG